ncbi:hyccin domain-containing protein [Phthorimaea operculella]|nr:hyccin domain-containing protein [Phthorimaea operculella]
MADTKNLVKEWLLEYNSLQEHEIRSFAAEHEHNHEIATAVFNLFYSEDDSEGHVKMENEAQYEEMLENVCTQLFKFFRSKEVELQRFTLQFVPTLIYTYLSSVVQTNKKTYRCVETLLIGIYNCEVVDEAGKPKTVSFRLPSLAQASIYHEPSSLGAQFLTESALRRWEECNTKLVRWGPLPQVEVLHASNRLKVMAALLFIYNRHLSYTKLVRWGPLPQVEVLHASNRLKVMAALLFIYNRHLSVLPKLALRHFCIAASRIVTQGFSKKVPGQKPTPRIPVSSHFLLELVHGAYFAMFNDFYTLALQAVKDVDRRAQYELLPEVMLVTSAVINSLKNSSTGQPLDGPMGISVALSPATTTVTMSKSMITNASFRTKKLPDDIPIQVGGPTADPADALMSITEEGETDSTGAPLARGTAQRASKPKLGSFPVLGKKSSKDGKGASSSFISNEKKVSLKDSADGGSARDDKLSLTSAVNSTTETDSRSNHTTDSLELEPAPRPPAMQVSSV